ncbi:MAG: Txe/YoeB family addiction module toxin [Chitinophagales bacterium]|jgi:toxin YoeB|nr:Txe/YoeB family addiction module toxin [Sphingobacteriales bacterium]
MRSVYFMPLAWEHLGWWVLNDLKMVRKIYQLLHNSAKTPFEGLGKPEPLIANYSGYWSRRINLEHRIVYKVENDKIVVHSLYGHYQD